MKISVAMCTFNGSARLAKQLESLAVQTRLPDELVVFDDCSTDATPQILHDFGSQSPFPVRIHLQNQNVGSAANFEAAIREADGEIIATCDQDDIWYPEKLARTEAAFSAMNGADLVFTDGDVVDDDLRPLGYSLWDSAGFTPHARACARREGLVSILARFNVVTGTAMAFASSWRDILLPIPSGWVHDGWIALMLCALGRCSWIDQPLLAYRQHDQQQIGAARNSLSRQIRTARAMDGAYFSHLADNFQQCLNRLGASHRPVNPHALEIIRQKVDHCRARARMRLERRVRLGLVARELCSGRYASAALGWKSLAQDLFQF